MTKKITDFLLLLMAVGFLSAFHLKFSPNVSIMADKNYTDYVSAYSAVVIDARSGEILYEKNKDIPLPPASITKIVTAIVALENIPLDQYHIVGVEVNTVPGSKIYLMPGDVVTTEQLLYGLLLESGNDAAEVLVQNYGLSSDDFMLKMNELVVKLGLKNTFFVNASGLNEDSSNYSSAYDMAVLTQYAMQNPLFRQIASAKDYNFTSLNGHDFYFSNHHRLVKNSEALLGKTGYTKKAGRTLVSAFSAINELIIVTFNDPCDWQTHRTLAEYYLTKEDKDD